MDESRALTVRRDWELGWVLRGFNGPVRRARKAKGLTQRQLAAVVGVHESFISGVEVLTRRPNPELRKNLADFLGLDAEDVWPSWLEPRDNPAQAVWYQKVDAQTFPLLSDKVRKEVRQLEDKSPRPEEAVSREFVRAQLRKALLTLTCREREVIKMRYGLTDDGVMRTLSECAEVFGVTRETVRQIEAKAIRKLGHPSRAKAMEGCTQEVFGEGVCEHCGNLRDLTRFCRKCKRPGCKSCLSRETVAGKYAYVCDECGKESA